MLVGACLNGATQITVIDKNRFTIITSVMNHLRFAAPFEVSTGSLGFKSNSSKFRFRVNVETWFIVRGRVKLVFMKRQYGTLYKTFCFIFWIYFTSVYFSSLRKCKFFFNFSEKPHLINVKVKNINMCFTDQIPPPAIGLLYLHMHLKLWNDEHL